MCPSFLSLPFFPQHLVVLSLTLCAASMGCGGGGGMGYGPAAPSQPSSGENKIHHRAGSVDSAETKRGGKGSPRGPAPFMEADCATAPADGYLADAKKAVAAVRQAHWEQLKACADLAPTGVNLSGEIRTSFRLDHDGVPRCVEAPGASVDDQDVVNCVVAAYRSFRFKKVPTGGSVRVSDGIHLDVIHADGGDGDE